MKLLMRYFSLPVYFVFLMSIFSAQSSLACCSFEEILDLSQGDLFGIASQDYRQTENSKKLYIDFYVNEKISYLDMLRKVLLANFLLSRDEGIKKINLNSVLRMLGKWEIIGGNDITEIGNFKLFVDHTLRNYSAENLREYSKNIVETDFFNFAKVQFRLYLRGAENFSSDLLSFINQNPSRKVQLFWIAFSAIDSARSYLSFEEVSLLDEMRSSFLLRNLPDGNSEINADVVGKMQKSQLRGFTKNDFQRYSYSLGQTWEESIRVDVSAPSQVERVINQPVNQVSPSISEARPSITEPRNQPQPPINNPQSRPNSAISSNEGASNGPIGLEPLTPEMINRNFKNGVQAPDGYSYLATYSREKKMGAKANYSQFVSSMFSLGETCVKRSPREWPEFLKNYDSVFYNSNYSLDTLNLGSDLESNQRTFSFILTVYAPRFKSPFAYPLDTEIDNDAMLNFKNIAETSSKNLKRMFSDYSNFLVKFKDSNLKLEMVGNFLDVLFRTDAKSANMLNEIKGVEMHSAIGLILKIDPDYIFTIQSQIDKLFDFPAKQIDMFRILGHVEHFKSKVGKYAGKDYEMRFGTWYEGLKQKILAKYNRIQRINAEAYELVNVPSSDSPSYFGTMENFGEEIQLVTNKFYDNIGLIGRFNGFRKYFFIENEYQFALNGWVEILNNSSNKDVFSLTEQNFKRIENSTLLKWVIVRAMLSRSEPPEEFIYKYVHEYLENISSQASLDFKKVNLLVSVILEGNSSITASNKGNFVDLIIYFLEGLRDKSTKIPAEAKYLFNFFARNFFEHGRPEDAESYAKLVKFFSTLKPGDYDFKYCDLNAIGI